MKISSYKDLAKIKKYYHPADLFICQQFFLNEIYSSGISRFL